MTIEKSLDFGIGDLILLKGRSRSDGSIYYEVSGFVVGLKQNTETKRVRLSHEHPKNCNSAGTARSAASIGRGDRQYNLEYFYEYDVLRKAEEYEKERIK